MLFTNLKYNKYLSKNVFFLNLHNIKYNIDKKLSKQILYLYLIKYAKINLKQLVLKIDKTIDNVKR